VNLELQRTYKYLIFLIGGILFAGALLDAISNSISLITLPIALTGTVLILLLWISMEFISKNKGINWSLPGGKKVTVRKINNQIKLFFVGIILTLWIPSFMKSFTIEKSTEQIEEVNLETKKIRKNIHDLSLYITHYNNSLLDSSNPKYFELKVKQIDTIKNLLEKHLEFIGVNKKIKIPTDTLDSRYLLREMVEFEKSEVRPKIEINLGESYSLIYMLSRNMWQYEYFFNIFQKTGDVHTQEALVQLRNNITDLSNKVNFLIDEEKLSSFLYSPTTEILDEIMLEK